MAAQDQAEIVFTADEGAVLKAYAKLEKANDSLHRKLDRMNGQNRTLGDNAVQSLNRMALGWMSVDRAIGATIGLIKDAKREYEEFIRASSEKTLTRSESFTQFRIQAGLGLDQERLADRAKTTHTAVAAATGQPATLVDQAAAQMASSGVSLTEIEGGGLLELMKGITIQGAAGDDVNIEDLVKATTMILKANKREVSAANIEALMVAFQGLKEKNIKLVDMIEYAKESGSVAELSHIPMEEQLAMYAYNLEVMPPEPAAVGTRTAIRELAAARNHPSRVAALGRLGLQPKDVDFFTEPGEETEGSLTVFRRLREGMKNVPGAEHASIVDAIFGARGGRVGEMLKRPELADELIADLAKMKDRTNYDKDFALFSKSQSAIAKGQAVLKENSMDDPSSANVMLARDIFQQELGEQRKAGRISPIRESLTMSAYDWSRFMSTASEKEFAKELSPDGYGETDLARDEENLRAGRISGMAMGGVASGVAGYRARRRIEQMNTTSDPNGVKTDETNALLKQLIQTMTKPQRIVIEGGNVPKPGKKAIEGVQ